MLKARLIQDSSGEWHVYAPKPLPSSVADLLEAARPRILQDHTAGLTRVMWSYWGPRREIGYFGYSARCVEIMFNS